MKLRNSLHLVFFFLIERRENYLMKGTFEKYFNYFTNASSHFRVYSSPIFVYATKQMLNVHFIKVD